MTPLVEEFYREWLEKSGQPEHDPQGHKDAWYSLIRLEIIDMRRKLRKKGRATDAEWIETHSDTALRDPEASYAPSEASYAPSDASSPLLVRSDSSPETGNPARLGAMPTPVSASRDPCSTSSKSRRPTATLIVGERAQPPSIEAFSIFCYRATDDSPRWTLMAEVREFQDTARDSDGLPHLSFGRFYRLLEDGFGPANTEGIRWRDQQNRGVVDILRPKDFEAAVHRAFHSGAGSAVFEICSLENP